MQLILGNVCAAAVAGLRFYRGNRSRGGYFADIEGQRFSLLSVCLFLHAGRLLPLRVNVRLVEPQSIARSQGKARRVLDQRKEG